MIVNRPIVLYYHQLVRRPRPEHTFFCQSLTPEQFRASMTHLKKRYHPLRMEEVYEILHRAKRCPPRGVLITFDDGFRNNLWAAQILHELGMSATFFIPSDVVDSDIVPSFLRYNHILSTRRGDVFDTRVGPVNFRATLSRRRWRARVREYTLKHPEEHAALLGELAETFGSTPIDPQDEDYHFVSSADVRALVELGMTVGSHGATHEYMPHCTDQQLHYEIVQSREKLGRLIGRPIDCLSYPGGHFNERVLALTAEHYKVAFATAEPPAFDNTHAYPRRAVGVDVREQLKPWYSMRRGLIRLAKRVLGG